MAKPIKKPIDLIQAPIEAPPLEVSAVIALPQGTRQLAGWWHRVAAFLLDAVFVAIPGSIAVALVNDSTTERVTVNLILIVAGIAYAAILLGAHGKTLGMRAVSISTIDARSGNELTKGAAWLRSLVAFSLYGLVPEIAFLYEASQSPGWITHHHGVTALVLLASFLLLLTFLWPIWDSRNQDSPGQGCGIGGHDGG